MRYTKFEIERYKGIRDKAIIDLSHLPNSKIFTMVGLNESGKTSLLEAINLLQNEEDSDLAYKMIHIADKGNFTGDITISATLELDEDDEQRIRAFCSKELSFTLTRPIQEITVKKCFKFNSSKFDRSHSTWTLPLYGKTKKGKTEKRLYEANREGWNQVVAFIESNFPRILFYENFLFEFPERIYLTSEYDVKQNQEYALIIQDILDSFDDNLTVQDHIVSRFKSASPEDESSLDAIMSQMEAKLTDVIMGGWGDVFTTGGDEIVVDIGEDKIGGVYIEIKIKQGHSRYSISERSLGFRWFFSFLLFTQFRKERKNEFGETLFLLDEPASNLHPKSQHNLLKIFEQLSNDCKIIYSTHSHHLIDLKNLPGTYIVQNKSIDYENESRYLRSNTDIKVYPYRSFASTHPNEIDHYKPILDAIDYEPSQLELDSDIICLEGKNDYYTFKLMSRLTDVGTGMKFYPGASVDKYDQLFRLYLAWGKNFLAVFDADRAGTQAKGRYEKDLGPDISGHIFLLSDFDSDWKGYTTEKLFTEQDKIRIIRYAFPMETTYNKGKFNTALQQIYIDGAAVDLDDETISNFTLLLNQIQTRISDLEKHLT
ncbi:MAG: ATP-binding protein [Eggerthellaceae bacterium]|nr:ATP-binding protein [Eggerthellaceae bacterium]